MTAAFRPCRFAGPLRFLEAGVVREIERSVSADLGRVDRSATEIDEASFLDMSTSTIAGLGLADFRHSSRHEDPGEVHRFGFGQIEGRTKQGGSARAIESR